ncbi:hypothetical protein DEJ39_03310 [Bacteroidetes bacterium SCGC AAA795-G10]|nr:hypothetical protein DEJ39_03310 [Bacteroidetes bacterium SCGC AAA795-G10]
MTEKIKTALVQWATNIIKDQSNWDDEKTHEAIQKIYELSIFQKMLTDQEEIDQSLWERHQKKLDEVINSLTEGTNKEKTKDDDMEVAPMMETIKNMVTEMPEPETYEKLFESVGTPPTFMSKKNDSIRNRLDTEKDISKDKKNINDQFSKKLSVDNNERLAFIKHLFDGDTINYERVLNQTLTLGSWSEVSNLISSKVKIEYNNWKGKEDIADRFLTVLQKSFKS